MQVLPRRGGLDTPTRPESALWDRRHSASSFDTRFARDCDGIWQRRRNYIFAAIIAPAEQFHRLPGKGKVGAPGIRGLCRDVRPAAQGGCGRRRPPAGWWCASCHDYGRWGRHGAIYCQVARTARRNEPECLLDGFGARLYERGAAERAGGQRDRVCARDPEA